MGTLGRMIEAGELSVADENLLKTKLADMLSSLIITKAEFTAAKVQLEILTGRKIECKVTLNRKPIFEGVIDIETLVDRVLAFHPTLKILDANIESAKSEVDTSKSKLWPSLYLRGEYRKGALYESDIDREESLIYLVLKMSTGAGASALSNVEKSKVKVLKIRFEKLSKEKLIIDKLMNNYTRLVAVITNKEILTRDVEIAKKVYGSNQKLFFLQQKKWTDVVNALTELNKKKISKAQLTAEYKVLESKIALQIGRLSLDTGEVMPYVLQ
jgi:outer membrane protein TolC